MALAMDRQCRSVELRAMALALAARQWRWHWRRQRWLGGQWR